MLKVSKERLDEMETQHKGVVKTIMRFENADLPPCPHCQSANTADVQVGLVGRTMAIAGATTKFHLLANGPKPGRYYCNDCKQYFGEAKGPAGGFTGRPKDRSFQAFKEFLEAAGSALGVERTLPDEELLESWRSMWGFSPDTKPEDILED